MQSHPAKRTRGRPKAATKGAKEAIAAIEREMEAKNISRAGLALALQMNPSSVTRALSQGDTPGWTPSLKRIYGVAIKGEAMTPKAILRQDAATLERLLDTPPAAAVAVRAILDDVQKLVDALSGPKRQGKPKRG